MKAICYLSMFNYFLTITSTRGNFWSNLNLKSASWDWSHSRSALPFRMDWKYKTEPQPGVACLGHTNQRCNWPRGKVLGGSSVLNYMLYVRGNRKDYDDWEAAGNPGWGYEEALHYFKKSEDNRNPYLAATKYHSTGGYLTVQEAPWRLESFFIKKYWFKRFDGSKC